MRTRVTWSWGSGLSLLGFVQALAEESLLSADVCSEFVVSSDFIPGLRPRVALELAAWQGHGLRGGQTHLPHANSGLGQVSCFSHLSSLPEASSPFLGRSHPGRRHKDSVL